MPIRHILLALLVVAIWGFNFVVIKMSVEAFPPILAAALRFAAAAFPAASGGVADGSAGIGAGTGADAASAARASAA